MRDSRHEVDRAGLLDRIVDTAVQFCGDTCDPARQDFPSFGGEFTQDLGVCGDYLLGGDVLPAAGHLSVRLAEIDAALNGLWLGHKY